ncbi:MAG: phosphoglycerate kinase [Bacteroidia bacterium]|nr:phosphoglycerate kinase [Bacteroidia bacterium]
MEQQNLPQLQDCDLKGKIVLLRVDHNVVKKGVINDPYRIDSTIGTLFYIYSKGGKAILMTHCGRPKDKKTGEIKVGKDSDIKPVVEYLKNKLHIMFVVTDIPQAEKTGYSELPGNIGDLVNELRDGKIDGIYLPNTRWFSGEEAKGEQAENFAKQLAGLADIYINDAFGSWQAHVSTYHVTKYLPSYAGFLMQKELNHLEHIFNPQKPFLAVVAGAKFDTKIKSLYALLKRADYLVLGGVIYNEYLFAKYGIEIKGIEQDDLNYAKEFYEFSKQYPGRLIELPYIIESDSIEGKFEGQFRKHYVPDLRNGGKLNFVLDAAEDSFKEGNIVNIFKEAKTIFVNAVMGLTPHFNEGTIALDKLIDTNKEAMKLYGGGDTLEEMKRLLPELYMKVLDNPKYYLFTGGGAVLNAIEDGTAFGMEPVKALLK